MRPGTESEAGQTASLVADGTPRAPDSWSPIPDIAQGGRSWVARLWRRICREQALLFSTAYVLVAFLGLWSSYWFHQGFGIAILDYLQASDHLVAGLRNPAHLRFSPVSCCWRCW